VWLFHINNKGTRYSFLLVITNIEAPYQHLLTLALKVRPLASLPLPPPERGREGERVPFAQAEAFSHDALSGVDVYGVNLNEVTGGLGRGCLRHIAHLATLYNRKALPENRLVLKIRKVYISIEEFEYGLTNLHSSDPFRRGYICR
jgi:hypothetical protein